MVHTTLVGNIRIIGGVNMGTKQQSLHLRPEWAADGTYPVYFKKVGLF